MVAVAGLLLLAACSDDTSGDEGSEESRAGEVAAEATTTTSTTQPSTAEDEEAAFAVVKALVAESSEVLDRLFEKPELVLDPGSRDLVRLTELYTEDSPGLEFLLADLEELADKDQRLQAGPSDVFSSELVWGFEAEGEDTVTFQTCAVFDTETVDAEGEVVDRGTMAELGTGTARRVDGIWRYHGVDANDDSPGEIEPDEVADVVRFCEALADAEEGS